MVNTWPVLNDAETIAAALRARAGVAPDETASPMWLAERLLGPKAVAVLSPLSPLAMLADRRVVLVRAGLPLAVIDWLVGHELGHWVTGTACQHSAQRGAPLEQLCDRIGAALQLPPLPYAAARGAYGEDWPAIARVLGATETAVVLRAGELEGACVAVVARSRVFVRGDGWPAESELRRWASVGAPGVRRAGLRDDPRRVALLR